MKIYEVHDKENHLFIALLALVVAYEYTVGRR